MFSGQGSQKPGMGADLFAVEEVRATFACASDVLGFDVADLVLNAEPEKLNDTRNAQPALCALSVAVARALMARGVEPAAVLGFSLGQVSALAVSGMLADEATFALVKARSELMAEAAAAHPGAMSALLKADEDAAQALCDECAEGDVLVPANFNCPGQIVVAGTPEAVERAEAAWAAAGKRSSRLATSGAFHSPLMADAAAGLAHYLEGVEFSEARIPLICNVDARPLAAADAREHLVRHLTSPVRFQQSVEALAPVGADTFVEVGFGGVLANLVKRIDKTATRACVQDRASFDALLVAQAAPDSE
ncbi:ACP S-malonyltransferase [Gordonibacter urolithinfaciens]|uniref:ACP S-malonyltransferase n=1 Tax=Gordonibacter urolithinfaciens TaxID=1335613 RepID=UPI003A931C6B